MICFWGDSFFVFVWGGGEDLQGRDTKARELQRQPSTSVTVGAMTGKLF